MTDQIHFEGLLGISILSKSPISFVFSAVVVCLQARPVPFSPDWGAIPAPLPADRRRAAHLTLHKVLSDVFSAFSLFCSFFYPFDYSNG